MTKTPSSTLAASSERALDPPGGVGRDRDPRLADDVADLPGRAAAVLVDVELRAARGSRARGASRSGCRRGSARRGTFGCRSRSRSWPTTYQTPFSGSSAYGLTRALGRVVARDRPVGELHRALLRDRALELAEPAGHLGRVVGVEDLDAAGRLGRRLGEAGPAEREVLQREPQRLRVRELARRAGRGTSGAPRARRRSSSSGGRKYCSERSVYSSSPVNSSRCEWSGTPSAISSARSE